MFYSKFGYPPYPNFIITYFHLFSSVYGFPHFSFNCFFIHLHPIAKNLFRGCRRKGITPKTEVK